jgi:hypothetical protein
VSLELKIRLSSKLEKHANIEQLKIENSNKRFYQSLATMISKASATLEVSS